MSRGLGDVYKRQMILSPDSWDDEYEDIVITGEDDRMVRFEGVVVWFQASKEME